MCKFKSKDIEPCENCPRRISALHKCKFLQEIIKENEIIEKEKKS